MFGRFLEFEREKKAKDEKQDPSRCWEDKVGKKTESQMF